jgi:hypothetical protein
MALGCTIFSNIAGLYTQSTAPMIHWMPYEFYASDSLQFTPITVISELSGTWPGWRGGPPSGTGRDASGVGSHPPRPASKLAPRAEYCFRPCNQSCCQFTFARIFREQSVPQSPKLFSIPFGSSSTSGCHASAQPLSVQFYHVSISIRISKRRALRSPYWQCGISSGIRPAGAKQWPATRSTLYSQVCHHSTQPRPTGCGALVSFGCCNVGHVICWIQLTRDQTGASKHTQLQGLEAQRPSEIFRIRSSMDMDSRTLHAAW